MGFDREVGRRSANAAFFCQLVNDFFSRLGNGGVFLHRVYASEHYGEVFDVNCTVCPAELGFERS